MERGPRSLLTYSRALRHLHLLMALGIFGALGTAQAAAYSNGQNKRRFIQSSGASADGAGGDWEWTSVAVEWLNWLNHVRSLIGLFPILVLFRVSDLAKTLVMTETMIHKVIIYTYCIEIITNYRDHYDIQYLAQPVHGTCIYAYIGVVEEGSIAVL